MVGISQTVIPLPKLKLSKQTRAFTKHSALIRTSVKTHCSSNDPPTLTAPRWLTSFWAMRELTNGHPNEQSK
jgi:hypothetical protein